MYTCVLINFRKTKAKTTQYRAYGFIYITIKPAA